MEGGLWDSKKSVDHMSNIYAAPLPRDHVLKNAYNSMYNHYTYG